MLLLCLLCWKARLRLQDSVKNETCVHESKHNFFCPSWNYKLIHYLFSESNLFYIKCRNLYLAQKKVSEKVRKWMEKHFRDCTVKINCFKSNVFFLWWYCMIRIDYLTKCAQCLFSKSIPGHGGILSGILFWFILLKSPSKVPNF